MKAYKFRSSAQIEFALDIIMNNRLFCSDWRSLNDPMEGEFAFTQGSVGKTKDVESRLRELHNAMNRYRVCALSTTFDSHLLWAHYAGGFNGLAIEVELPDNDKNVQLVKPRDVFSMVEIDKMKDPNATAREVLFSKYHEWAYEKEVRILQNTEYFSITRPTMLIAGPKMQQVLQDFLNITCNNLGIQFRRLGIGDDGLDADYVTPLTQLNAITE